MSHIRVRWVAALCAALLSGAAAAAEIGFEVGSGFSADAADTSIARVLVRVPMHATEGVRPAAGWSLWWEGGLGGWRYRDNGGARKRLVDVTLTPILRYRFSPHFGWFAEGGIGVHWLSRHYQRHANHFSTRWQFGSHLGVGYAFNEARDHVMLRVQHLSNGGLKKPNPGAEAVLLNVSHTF